MPPQCTLFDRIAYLAESNVKCIWFKNTSSNILRPPIKSKHSYTYPGSKYIHESWQRLMDDPIYSILIWSAIPLVENVTKILPYFLFVEWKSLETLPMVGAVKSHWIFFSKVKRRLLSLSALAAPSPTASTTGLRAKQYKYPVMLLKYLVFSTWKPLQWWKANTVDTMY